MDTYVETALGASECNPNASEIPLGGIITRLLTFANAEKLPVAAAGQELAHPLLSLWTVERYGP
jgi:hypothetical protein